MNRILVLMLCDAEDEQCIFAGALYSGGSIVDSVYLNRAAMLRWLMTLDVEAGGAAARAMDELLTEPNRALRSVPVCAGASGLPVSISMTAQLERAWLCLSSDHFSFEV